MAKKGGGGCKLVPQLKESVSPPPPTFNMSDRAILVLDLRRTSAGGLRGLPVNIEKCSHLIPDLPSVLLQIKHLKEIFYHNYMRF